jgi:hypothetical protein
MAVDEPTTPVAPNANLQLSLEPPTLEKRPRQRQEAVPAVELEPKTGSANTAQTPQALRYRKLSQTVRARTSKWANGRFENSLTTLFGAEDGEGVPLSEEALQSREAASATTLVPQPELVAKRKQPSSPPSRVENALELVLEKFSSISGVDLSTNPPSQVVRSSEREEKPKRDNQSNATRMILELWLWFQFIIIVLVFVGAMFNRGPRSVLSDARAKKAVGPR